MAARAQVNLWFPYRDIDFPFINVMKSSDRIWLANGATEDHFALLDAQGYPTQMPSGASAYQTYTGIYLTDNDHWVFTWDGVGTISVQNITANVSASYDVLVPNRQEIAFTSETLAIGTSVGIGVQINSTPVSNIRVFRKSQESLLDAGQKFAPHFLEKYSGWGSIRFMDWQWTNASPQTTWALRPPVDHVNWTGQTLLTGAYCGRCTVVSGTDFTAPNALSGNPSSWTDRMTVQVSVASVPSFKAVSAISNANPAVVTCTGHGFSTGDKVFWASGTVGGGEWSWRLAGYDNGDSDAILTEAGKAFTITVINANSFSLDGVDSTSWGTCTSPGSVSREFRLKAGALPFKRLVYPSFINLFTTHPNSDDVLWTCVYDADFDCLTLTPGPVAGGAGHSTSVPIEILVELANELQINPWFCIPHMATDDYVTQFATYVRDHLSADLVARYELSNEVWNTANAGFLQTPYARFKGGKKWGERGNAAYNKYHGWRHHQVMSLIDAVYVGQEHRRERVLGVWTAQAHDVQVLPRFLAAGTGLATTPISKTDSIALAPYCEPARSDWWVDPANWTAQADKVWAYNYGTAEEKAAALAWLDARWRAEDGLGNFTVDYLTGTLFPAWKAIAGTYGVALTQYEGGWGGISGLNSPTEASYNGQSLSIADVFNFFAGFYNSPHYARITTELLNKFVDIGGEYPSQYCLVGGWGDVGMWGMFRDNIFATPVPAYDALKTFNAGKRLFRTTG